MLRTKLVCFCLVTVAVPTLAAAQAAPQTARQALIEMFFSPTSGTLQKHLPDAMVAAMKKANLLSESSTPEPFGLFSAQLRSKGQLQTFEAGPILLSFENPRDNSRFEIVVEHDDLRAGEDDIEVSVRGYKDREPQLSGLSPRLIFGMKQENGIWKLGEMTVTFKLSLTDPEFLKALGKWQPPVASATLQTTASNQASGHNFNEASIIIAMRTVARAETKYAAAYGHGYTCSLSDLGGFGADEADDHHAKLIEPGLASGRKYGYRFALAGCEGSSKFTLSSTPADGSGQVFCVDESGVVRTSTNSSTCLTNGTLAK